MNISIVISVALHWVDKLRRKHVVATIPESWTWTQTDTAILKSLALLKILEKLNNSNNEKLKKEVNKSNRTTNENTQSKNKIWMNFFLYQKEQ